MLVLMRRKGERLYLDIGSERIVIEVKGVQKGLDHDGQVALAISAPKHVHILRAELERKAS